jgi:hypothetical protein
MKSGPRKCVRQKYPHLFITGLKVIQNSVLMELGDVYGFVVDIDRMAYKFDLPSGDKFPFRFPERHAPVNCYTYEVVVSKFQEKILTAENYPPHRP